MIKARHASPAPTDLVGEIERLDRAGFSLLPLGGADGKTPLVQFGHTPRLPATVTIKMVQNGKAAGYCIRLGGLAVLDIDTYDENLVADLQDRFGETPVVTRTPRGVHLFYRLAGQLRLNLKTEGLPVDVKWGQNSHVVGAGSTRPDGGCYLQAGLPLSWDILPIIKAQTAKPIPITKSTGGLVPVGSRHRFLLKSGLEMVECVDSPTELLGNLQHVRDDEVTDPATVPDVELTKIADWCWSRRLENRVYIGRASAFPVSRTAVDLLQGRPGGSDALALFMTLCSMHGHIPGKTFGLNHAGMKAAGLTDLSRDRFQKAVEILREVGLLAVAAPHIAGQRRRQYQLCSPHVAAVRGASADIERRNRRGGGSFTYIC